MAFVDSTYYTGTYDGTTISDSDVFDKINNRAEEVIIAYTNNLLLNQDTYDDLNTYQQTGVKKAICSQIEFLFNLGGYNATNNADDINAGFSLSKFRINNSTSGKSKYQLVEGIPLSPNVNMYLKNTGLLYRGLDVLE